MTNTNNSLGVLTIAAFKDNYIWMIHNGKYAVVVDPGDAKMVLDALFFYKLELIAILITHHHPDHIGGVPILLQQYQVPVFGPDNPAIGCITHKIKHNDTVDLPEFDMQMVALEVPGHTLDHVAYVSTSHGWLFCGDTLFAAGCGRMFEGTPIQMHTALSLLATMPDTTLVFCAHEYTLANLRFALAVEPNNSMLRARLKVDENKRANNRPTLPSNIGLEKQTNPFLRCSEPEVIHTLLEQGKLGEQRDPVSVFAALRQWKNIFK